MVDKEEGRVPCAHCSNARAARACPHCGHMVCGICDDGTLGACTRPRSRALALPAGCRAADADPEGERVLYAKPGGGWGHLDLASAGEARPLAAAAAEAAPAPGGLPQMCALGKGRLARVWRKKYYFNLMQRLEVQVHEPWGVDGRYRRAIASNHDFWLFGQGGDVVTLWGHKVEVFEGGEGASTVTLQLPRFMTSGSIRGGVLALGAGRLVLFYRTDVIPRADPATRELGSLLLPADALWLRLARATLVLLVRAGEGRAMALAAPYAGGPPPEEEVPAAPRFAVPCGVGGPLQATCSRDGRLIVLATPTAGEVVAVDLISGAQQLVTACRGPLELVKLVDEDRVLVTASTLGEVGVWHVRQGRIVTPEGDGAP